MATPPLRASMTVPPRAGETLNDRSLHRDRRRLRGVLASRSEDPGGRGALPARLGSRHGHPGPAPHEVGQSAGRPPRSKKRRPAWPTQGTATRHGRITCPLPTTVIPPSDTTTPRARPCFFSPPPVAPASTTTFLSRIAFSTTARRPTRELCRTTARSTRAQLCTCTPGARPEFR